MSSDVHVPEGHHEEIHLPPPSWAPVVVGLGATVAASGIVFPLFLPVGLILFLVGVWKLSGAAPFELLRTSMGVDSRMLGMWVFLASEIMFFSGLIATFLGYKARSADVGYLLNIPLMTIATFVLLTSSFAAVSALTAVQQNKMKRFRNWLIVTMVLGTLFLGMELLEWIELLGHGITTGSLYGSAFFTLTGFHGMHVLVGLIMMGFLLVRYYRGRITGDSVVAIELFGLYWHFVDIVWIVLFTIIYLI